MKIPGLIILLGLTRFGTSEDERHALFVHTGSLDPLDPISDYSEDLDDAESRQIRQTEYTVRSILEWLQGRYTQPSKKVQRSSNRQEASPSQPDRQYLPVPEQPIPEQPITDRPRPFQPNPTIPPTSPPETPSATYIPAQPSGPPLQPGYPSQQPPQNGYPSQNQNGYPSQQPSQNGYPSQQPSQNGYPSQQPSQNGYPTQQPSQNGYPSQQPSQNGYPTQQPNQNQNGYPSQNQNGYPSQNQNGYPSQNGYPQPDRPQPPFPSPQPGVNLPPSTLLPPGDGPYTRPPSPQPPFSTPTGNYPSTPETFPPGPGPYPGSTPGPYPESTPGNYPGTTPGSYPGSTPETYPGSTPGTTPESIPGSSPGSGTTGGGDEQVVIGTGPNEVDGENHPPHIHEIHVQCAKDMMTIDLEFNRPFDGLIYSKGFYKDEACRYVNQNSGQTKFSFTVRLNSCGTQFIDQFKEGGQAYLENVLVIQNEPGIQEVWDMIRKVRCLWEGNIKESLSVSLNIGMLSSEINTFSGDTAVATLDIQMGRGPFAPQANGLVKIGETMTLVVSVEGDPGFDIQVRDCVARDATSTNIVRLTDERGCVLRPKLIGAFQKTRETGASGASIIAYAFFQAFKFPDVMDLTLECNVELCKTDCEACPEQGQKVDPGRRRRRDIWVNNTSLGDPVRVVRTFRVITPDDVEDAVGTATIVNVGSEVEGVCMSLPGFLLAVVFLLSILVGSCLFCTYLWLKLQRNSRETKFANTVHLETFPMSKA